MNKTRCEACLLPPDSHEHWCPNHPYPAFEPDLEPYSEPDPPGWWLADENQTYRDLREEEVWGA